MRPIFKRSLILLMAVAAMLLSDVARGQWASQTITLRAGWNAVYLEVQPEPHDCDTLFAGLPVESAWRFNRKQAKVQFIDDPSKPVLNSPDWLTWLPISAELSSQSKLFTLEGARPYLIKVADNATSFNWTVKGTPVLRKPEWLSPIATNGTTTNTLNFVGFPMPTNAPPTFYGFFTNAPALTTNLVYRMNSSGIWVQVNTPATTTMQRGEAFWIRATGAADYAGPLEIQMDQRAGLDFGRAVTEQTIKIRNPSTNVTRTVVLRQLPSESPPSTAYPGLAGSVPLSYWQNDFSKNLVGWTNFPSQLIQSNLAPQGVWEVRMQVRRHDMTPYSMPAGLTNAFYQSLLEVTDLANTTRLLIPVKSEGLQSFKASTPGAFASFAPTVLNNPRTGLWIGNVTINSVSQPSSATPLVPVPTGSEFQFRILLHVNAAGQATFLQKVLQMWKPGVTNSAGQVIQSGRFVLLTDENLITSQYTGAAVRDGKLVGRRFSTAAFGFRYPIPMTSSGNFGDAAATASCSVVMGYDNPLNPLVHRYHPDHDNLDDRTDALGQPIRLAAKTNTFGQLYTSESTDITRSFQLTFTAGDPDNLALPGWGDSELGGTYSETLTGMHKTPIMIQGTFRLQLASAVSSLNDVN